MNDDLWLKCCQGVAEASNAKNKFRLEVISAQHVREGFAGVHSVDCTVDFYSSQGCSPMRIHTCAGFGGCDEWDGIFLPGFMVNCNGDISCVDLSIKTGNLGSLQPGPRPDSMLSERSKL
jgi:hypothetical protein